MINIWGLSKIKKESEGTQTTDEIKKIIKDEIAETLNFTSVDPNEIVVFGDKQGKLKTSNVSLDDILTRVRGAADNTIALFQDGRLKPGALINTITDKLTEYDKEFTDHVKNYNNFRNNIIYKFFGRRLVVTPSLAEIKTGLDKLNEITLFSQQLETINTDVTAIKDDLIKIISRAEKVKIPHDANKVNNLVYTRQSGQFDWTTEKNKITINSTVKGIYQVKIISPIKFNLSSLELSGVDNAISVIVEKDATQQITIARADGKSDNVSVTYYINFEAELK